MSEAFLTKTNYGQDIPFSDKCVGVWRLFGRKKKAGAQEMFRPIRTGKIFWSHGKGRPNIPSVAFTNSIAIFLLIIINIILITATILSMTTIRIRNT